MTTKLTTTRTDRARFNIPLNTLQVISGTAENVAQNYPK